jgi:hypothetical protein
VAVVDRLGVERELFGLQVEPGCERADGGRDDVALDPRDHGPGGACASRELALRPP